jgi:hypothetical protein
LWVLACYVTPNAEHAEAYSWATKNKKHELRSSYGF